VLHERLNRATVEDGPRVGGLAATGVAYLTCSPGVRRGARVRLAVSFSLLRACQRKVISVDALPGLRRPRPAAVALALGYLALWCTGGRRLPRSTLERPGGSRRWLIGSGLVTAIPLFPVRLRGPCTALLDARGAAVHRPEPAAACAACSSINERLPARAGGGALAAHLGVRCLIYAAMACGGRGTAPRARWAS